MYSVVVIDDEFFTRKALIASDCWGKSNCEISGEAECGVSGLELIKTVKPQIAIVDIAMPNMDGMEMVQKLRETDKEIFVIMLTGYSDFSYVQKSIRIGVADYLLKPIQDDELYSSLKMVIDKIDARIKPEEAEAPMVIRDKKDYLMLEIMEHIETYYSDSSLSIETICEALSYNYHYLSKVFKEREGTSLGKYIFAFRMEKAKELIKAGECYMKRIASSVGYDDELYFMKCFKRHFGKTPTQYIKMKKEK